MMTIDKPFIYRYHILYSEDIAEWDTKVFEKYFIISHFL